MRRRDFIIAGSAAATWPLLARAQQGERARHIAVLMNIPEDDPKGQARFAAFLQGMQQLGWADGRNIRIDTRWGGSTNLAAVIAAATGLESTPIECKPNTRAAHPRLVR